jgi:hypothetical protein
MVPGDVVHVAGMAAQDDDAVAHEDRFVDRMGDEDHGGGPLFPDSQQLELKQVARLRVE